MLPRLTKLGGLGLDLLFPRSCVGCGGPGSFLCEPCRNSLPTVNPPLCPRCGIPQSTNEVCPGCLDHPGALDGMRSPYRFDGVVRQAVHKLKYQNLRALAEPLADLLADHVADASVTGSVLVPVPLHRRRLRERGYNQSALLARRLGERTGIPVSGDCLIRSRQTPPQARTASVSERRENVAGVFACRDQRLRGERVLLIDDVATSGATMEACAAALKAAGACSVWGLTLAREI